MIMIMWWRQEKNQEGESCKKPVLRNPGFHFTKIPAASSVLKKSNGTSVVVVSSDV